MTVNRSCGVLGAMVKMSPFGSDELWGCQKVLSSKVTSSSSLYHFVNMLRIDSRGRTDRCRKPS